MKSRGRLLHSSPPFHKRPEGLEISAIGFYEVAVLWGFDDHRDPAQAGISDEAAERLEADRPLADVLVTVHATSQLLFAVVDVNDLQGGDAHDLIELAQDGSISLWRPDIIAGCKQVTGIQADSRPLREADLVQE